MKKRIIIGLVGVLISMAYALPSDNFNDNSRDTLLWSLFQARASVWLEETSGRLEVHSTTDSTGAVVLYFAHNWGFSTLEDFSFKVDFYVNSISTTGDYEFGVMAGIGKGGGGIVTIGDNNTTISATRYVSGSEIWSRCVFDITTDGSHIESLNKSRTTDSGTLYVSYNANLDELYISDIGFGLLDAWVIKLGLLRGTWNTDMVIPFIGGSYTQNLSLGSGDVYLDNFIVTGGTIIYICEYSLVGDLNDDCKVDLSDFALMAQNWLIDCDMNPSNPACVSK